MTENASWYCQQNGADPIGPGTTEDLVTAIRSGHVGRDARVCRELDAAWTPITDVPAFAIAFRDVPRVARRTEPSRGASPGPEIALDPEPPAARPLLLAAASLVLLTILWEAFAWIGTTNARQYPSAAVEARLFLFIIVLPGLVMLLAGGLTVFGLRRHARRSAWMLQREAPPDAADGPLEPDP